jgi:hypothetical protein
MTVPELKLLQVGECIEPIRTWNPAQDSEDRNLSKSRERLVLSVRQLRFSMSPGVIAIRRAMVAI